MYFVWIVILLAHLRFRRSIGAKVNDLPLRLHLFPLANILGIVVLVAIACSTFFVEGLRYSVPDFAVLLAIISILYWKVKHGATAGAAVPLEANPESLPPEP
jgi:L-asparagine transporter-like permease